MFMLRGAEVLLHPTSDHGASDMWSWESAKKVRASENMMYLISANQTGQIGGPSAAGPDRRAIRRSTTGTAACWPNTGGPGESTVCSDWIDVEALRRVRVAARFRQPAAAPALDMYRPLYNATTLYPANSFADAPMDSRDRILEVQHKAYENLVRAGVITPPSDR